MISALLLFRLEAVAAAAVSFAFVASCASCRSSSSRRANRDSSFTSSAVFFDVFKETLPALLSVLVTAAGGGESISLIS